MSAVGFLVLDRFKATRALRARARSPPQRHRDLALAAGDEREEGVGLAAEVSLRTPNRPAVSFFVLGALGCPLEDLRRRVGNGQRPRQPSVELRGFFCVERIRIERSVLDRANDGVVLLERGFAHRCGLRSGSHERKSSAGRAGSRPGFVRSTWINSPSTAASWASVSFSRRQPREPQEAHVAEPSRLTLIGESRVGRIVLVVFTELAPSGNLRIISARRATKRERRAYEED